MAFKDDLKLILAGGLPALIDGPTRDVTTQETTNEGLPATVEQITPEPQLRDREPFLLSSANGMNGSNMNMLIAFAVVGAIVYAVTRK